MAIKPKAVGAEVAAPAGVGLNPDAWVEGGGLADDFDGTVLDCRFTKFDYNGTADKASLALAFELLNEEEEQEEGKNPFVQYYSAGDLEYFVPSDDGLEAVPVGNKTGLNKNTNAYKMIMSILGSGFDVTKIGSRVDVFVNERFHFKRAAKEERKGMKKTEKQLEREAKFGPDTILLAETYLGPVGAATAAPAAAKAPAPPAPKPAVAAAKPVAAAPKPAAPKPPVAAPASVAAAPAVDEAVATMAQSYILEQLANAGGSHPKIGLGKAVIAWAKENNVDLPIRNGVIKALGNEAFLSQEGMGWTFDGETLTLA